MARPTVSLILALRDTAARLARADETYKWSHFANCNCGHLAQTITRLAPSDIYHAAFEREGDWGQQARDYCPTSGYRMDWILERMMELGMHPEDVGHLERLSDPKVRRRVGRELRHTRRPDVVDYMTAWADLLEERLPERLRPEPYPLADAAE
jgi:hypothetical protein